MKIAIGGVQIVDTSDGSGASVTGALPEIQRLIEAVQPIRAANQNFIYRGNKSTGYNFRVSLPCNSSEAAPFIYHFLETSIPANGSLVLTNGSNSITVSGQFRGFSSPLQEGSRISFNVNYEGGGPSLPTFTLSVINGQYTLTDEEGHVLE